MVDRLFGVWCWEDGSRAPQIQRVIDFRVYGVAGPPTHVKPLLRAHLLHQQHLRDPQLHAHVRDRLAVDEVPLQAHVTPYAL